MAVTPQERQFLLSQVNRLATRDLQNLWVQADRLSDVEFAAFVIAAFPTVVDPYIGMSAQLAATWFELSAPASPYIAVAAPPVPVERLTQSARWALGAQGNQGLARLQGTTQRAVFDGARMTTTINVARSKDSRWVRHAQPDACAFCRLLSTRHSDSDYWYTTNNSAVDVVGKRGTRKQGDKYHDDCRCIAVEVREGQEYEPPDYVQQWDSEYLKARANSGSGDPKSILAAWRTQAADIK